MIQSVFIKLSSLLVVSMLFFPVMVLADDPETPTPGDTTSGIVYECRDGDVYGNCDFNDLVRATKHAVNYGTAIALSFITVVIAWAGFNYMISGDNPGAKKKATTALTKSAIGIGFIMGAWLIVTLITNALLEDDIIELVPLGVNNTNSSYENA